MATAPTKLLTDKGERRLDVKKGDRVRLLLPLWDGVQRTEADVVIFWPFDTPPTAEQACLPDDNLTPLDAPAMTDGKPPEGYLDPVTGKPPVIQSA